MYKYFIEDKYNHTWLTIDGGLTNNPLDKSLFSYSDKPNAEKWLKSMENKWEVSLQNMFINRLKLEYNLDLFNDFIITEHEFIK